MSNCEQGTDRIIDYLTENVDEGERVEVERHVRECARCRSEERSLRALWHELGEIDFPDVVSDHAVGSSACSMGSSQLRKRWRPWSGIAAALVLALLGGYAMGTSRRVAPGLPAPGNELYLLLLRQAESFPGPGAPTEPALVREYGEWAETLAAQSRLLAAERLDDDLVRFLGASGELDLASGQQIAPVVSGFFLIQASDLDDAMRTARGSPHLRYGGWIELRATQRD